jgi:hypothetical protein
MAGDKKLCDATDFCGFVAGLASMRARQDVVPASYLPHFHSSRIGAVDAGRLTARRKRRISRQAFANVTTSTAEKQNRSGDPRAVLSNDNLTEHTMKNTLIALAAALTFSALPAAYAQDSTPQVNVGAPQSAATYTVTPNQFAEYAFTYRLSNGQKISFTQSGNRYFAQVDHGKRVRIRALSDHEFATEQGAHIMFREYGDEVGINNFEKLPMAQVLPANTMMVARR